MARMKHKSKESQYVLEIDRMVAHFNHLRHLAIANDDGDLVGICKWAIEKIIEIRNRDMIFIDEQMYDADKIEKEVDKTWTGKESPMATPFHQLGLM